MAYRPDKRHRRSFRLKDFDYSQPGAYFITISVHHRRCLLGYVINSQMRTNGLGKVVIEEWIRSGEIRRGIVLDEFIVMPDHIHGVVGPKPHSIGAFVCGFKSAATKRINEIRGMPGAPVWQRNYYEHVIRNETDLDEIREYIRNNAMKWPSDEENPENIVMHRRE